MLLHSFAMQREIEAVALCGIGDPKPDRKVNHFEQDATRYKAVNDCHACAIELDLYLADISLERAGHAAHPFRRRRRSGSHR